MFYYCHTYLRQSTYKQPRSILAYSLRGFSPWWAGLVVSSLWRACHTENVWHNRAVLLMARKPKRKKKGPWTHSLLQRQSPRDLEALLRSYHLLQAKHRAFRHEILKISARVDSGAKWNTTKAFWKWLVTLKEMFHLPRRWTRFSSSSPTTSFCLFLILFMWTVFLKETASFWLFNADQAWALRIGNCTVTQPHSHGPIACISRVLALHLV